MSVVLYVIGAALFLWSGYLLVTGDFIATLDIAASLAGSGAFAIGLGAVAGAIGRLTRTIAASAAARDVEPATPFERDPPLPPRRVAPSPSVPPAAPKRPAAVAPAPELYLERALDLEPSPAPEPVFEPEPASRAEPQFGRAPEPVVSQSPEPEPEPAPPPLTKRERRRLEVMGETDARSPAQPGVEAPVVVAPILGGGFAPRRAAEAPSVEAPEIVAAEAPAVPEPAAEQPAVAAAPAVEPEVAAPAPVEPKVPEWLARARARREARAQVETPSEPEAPEVPVTPEVVAPEPEAPTAVDAEPLAEPLPIQAPADVESPSEELSPPDPGREVLREGEHNGVLYRFFADGSVEAESEHGMRRFASLEELRATILAVRGHIDDDVEDDATARPEAELMVAPPEESPAPAPQPPAGAEAPAPVRSDDDFEAALAALEGRAEAAPRLDELRPSR